MCRSLKFQEVSSVSVCKEADWAAVSPDVMEKYKVPPLPEIHTGCPTRRQPPLYYDRW